ncbi:MAG: Hsp20/alpha crystallin family protein [Cyanobacteria bacterium J06626_18]
MVRYWYPLQEMETLRRQFDHMFDEVRSSVESAPTRLTPAVRLAESGDGYVLTVQLPGVAPEKIDVQVTRETVEIKGELNAPELADGTRALYDDTRYGVFHRIVNLPEAIRNDAIAANFNHGLLTLTLPKVEEARNKVVKINLGQLTGSTQPAAEDSSEVPEAAVPEATQV